MRWTRIIASAFCAVALLGSSSSLAAAQATPGKPAPVTVELPPPPKPLLPDAFAGWVAAEPPKNVIDPAQADSANVSALKEYGFTHAVLANYKRDGETLTVRALSFHRYQRMPTAHTPSTARMAGPKKRSEPERLRTTTACSSG